MQRIVFLLLICFAYSYSSIAQQNFIKGVIEDTSSNAPLSYATIQIISEATGELIGGGITDDNGRFLIETLPAQQHVLVDYIGYLQFKTNAFTINSGDNAFDIGTISLAMSSAILDEVVVQAERSTMEFAQDKRIFNVGKDLGNAGGSAIEILNNIPSVLVDGEGNIKMRGSDNVRILIDGKPSGLVSFKGGAGLQQLQASLIDKVEVITNPSAKYEAEGLGGIINIVLKKEQKNGFNGSFESTVGYPVNVGLAANLNYRHKKVNFFFNYGMNYRRIPRVTTTYQEVYTADDTFISDQRYESEHVGLFNNARGGIEYFINESNSILASYMYSRSKGKRLSDITYEDYSQLLPNQIDRTLRTQDEDEVEPIAEYVLNYTKRFKEKDHEFSAEVRYFDHWEDSDQIYTQETIFADGQIDRFTQTAPNDETETQLITQLDYSQPFGLKGKYEFGLRASFRDMTNDYVVNDVNEAGQEIPIASLDNKFVYKENINAIYGIIGNKTNDFSYQFGLRSEWTDIETRLEETSQSNPRNYVNLFPSAHFSYDLPKDNAIQLSYSRRVRRPVYNDLSSYVTFSDNRNFFSGNPDLNPEYSDVYDLGHIKFFDKGSVATSIYYRKTTDKIERLREVDENGFFRTLPQNLIGENAYGAEFVTSYAPQKWWKSDLNINLFRAEVDGSNINEDYVSETFSWFARYTSRFTINNDTYLQLRANYEAPQNIAQGRRKAIYFIDLAFNTQIFESKGTLTFNVTDIFNTRRSRIISQGQSFFTDRNAQRQQRQINLTIGYKINQG